MHRVLGVTCSGADAYLTVIDVDEGGNFTIATAGPERVRPVSAGDYGDGLVRSLAEWRRVISDRFSPCISNAVPASATRRWLSK